MTEISLLFNPFTSQLGETSNKKQKASSSQQTDQSELQSSKISTKREKYSNKKDNKKSEQKDRTRSPTPRMDELMRRSALSNLSIDDSLSSSTIATQPRVNPHNIK